MAVSENAEQGILWDVLGSHPAPAPLNYLKKSAATDHTVCVHTTLIVCDYL